MRVILSLLLSVLIGCSSTSTVKFPDGKVFTVKAKPDEFITITRDGTTYVFDRRGRPTLFESIVTMIFMDTKIKNEVKEVE